MKTAELLDKYIKIIAAVLQCAEDQLQFCVNGKPVGELYFDKPEIEVHWSLGNYTLQLLGEEKPKVIAIWKLYQLQHCCAFMVSCSSQVYPEYRGKRIGTILNTLRQDIGRLLGYSAILCTDIEQNVAQRKLLATNGWKDIHSIVNKRTKNRVYLSVINI